LHSRPVQGAAGVDGAHRGTSRGEAEPPVVVL
jgi:hypothetical protein